MNAGIRADHAPGGPADRSRKRSHQQEIESLEEQLAASAGSDAKALSRRIQELQDRKQAHQNLVEKHLGRFAQVIREMRQQVEEEFRMMPPPPNGVDRLSSIPIRPCPSPPKRRVPPRRRWPFFDKFRERDEATQRRIEALEQQVEELKARVQELENRPGKQGKQISTLPCPILLPKGENRQRTR
jgi:DNA repair exonuclease SbcCD ATPase subunit